MKIQRLYYDYLKDYLLSFWKMKKPLVIQMPITSRCNSRCVTCNIWKYKDNTDIDSETLRKALLDPFFSEVHTVGLNGGEFTLVPDFVNILESVLSLPKIKNIYLISNGLYPKRLFEYLSQSKSLCSFHHVNLHICISVDGYGAIHEKVRGIPNCFSRTKAILDELYKSKEVYCDSFSVGCTLSKDNIGYIRETEAFFRQYNNLSVEYHLAVPNKRIKTFDDYERYYVLNDEKLRLLAAEFFYEKFLLAPEGRFKEQQFVNYYFLKNNGVGRLCKCDFLNRDITIDENLNMALCATASDNIGNLAKLSATQIIDGKKTKIVRKAVQQLCNTCIHYSYNSLTFKGRLLYLNEILRCKYALKYYEICTIQGIISQYKAKFSLCKQVLHDYLVYIYIYIWKLQ